MPASKQVPNIFSASFESTCLLKVTSSLPQVQDCSSGVTRQPMPLAASGLTTPITLQRRVGVGEPVVSGVMVSVGVAVGVPVASVGVRVAVEVDAVVGVRVLASEEVRVAVGEPPGPPCEMVSEP